MIYLIEKLWIDPMENHNAHGYSVHGYVTADSDAKRICDNSRMLSEDDCWSLKYSGPLKEYRYVELEELST